MPHDVVRQHRVGVRHLVAACGADRLVQQRAVGARHDAGRLRRGLVRAAGGERRSRRACAVVVGHGVVVDDRLHRILQRDAAARRSGRVVHHLVVGDVQPVPRSRIARAPAHVQAVDELGADTAAVARTRLVALHQVGRHRHVAAARRERRGGRRGQRGLAADEDAAAGDIRELVERLVEDHGVVGDGAVVAPAQMADAAAVAHGEVAADMVARNLVAVAAGMQRNPAARAVAAAVLRDVVVMDAHIGIQRVGVAAVLQVGGGIKNGRIDQVRMAEPDAAAVGAMVADELVVADLQEPGIAVDEDAAAVVRTADGEAVDACVAAVVERLRAARLGHYQDARALFAIEQGGLVVGRVKAGELAGQQVEAACGNQLVDLVAPCRQFVGRHLGRVDVRGRRPPALQTDFLVHDDEFVIDAGRHHDQVAGYGGINRGLDFGAGRDDPDGVGGCGPVAAYRDRDTGNAGLAVAARDLQLPGARPDRNAGDDDAVAPGDDRQGRAVKRYCTAALGRAETMVAQDGHGGGRSAVVRRVGHFRHAGRDDGQPRLRGSTHGRNRHVRPVLADAARRLAFHRIDHRRARFELAVQRGCIDFNDRHAECLRCRHSARTGRAHRNAGCTGISSIRRPANDTRCGVDRHSHRRYIQREYDRTAAGVAGLHRIGIRHTLNGSGDRRRGDRRQPACSGIKNVVGGRRVDQPVAITVVRPGLPQVKGALRQCGLEFADAGIGKGIDQQRHHPGGMRRCIGSARNNRIERQSAERQICGADVDPRSGHLRIDHAVAGGLAACAETGDGQQRIYRAGGKSCRVVAGTQAGQWRWAVVAGGNRHGDARRLEHVEIAAEFHDALPGGSHQPP